jgi:hypothetical protein
LTVPAISTWLTHEQEQIRIEITSCSFARLVESALEGMDVIFCDNYLIYRPAAA